MMNRHNADKQSSAKDFRREWAARGFLILTGVALLASGLFSDLGWLAERGIAPFDPRHPAHERYMAFFPGLLIITGVLSLILGTWRYPLFALQRLAVESPRKALGGLLLLFLVIAGWIAHGPFRNYPFCMDEYNFFYQAQIFNEGRLFLEFPEKFSIFTEQYVIFDEGRLFSKYAPGFPLLLAIGVLFGLPGWVNPLLALATLVVLYCFITTFIDRKTALPAVVLMASTPYFLGYSASYFSQPLALLLTALGFYFLRQFQLTEQTRYLILCGLAAGYAAMTRPLDAFCLMVPAGFYLLVILYRKKQLPRVVYPLAAFSLLFGIFLTYNYLLTGRISIATYPIVEGEFKVVDRQATSFIENLLGIAEFYWINAKESLPPLFGKHFLLPTAILTPLFALVGVFRWKSGWKWVLLANFALLVLLYNFHPGTGWPQYGARYYYSGYFAVVVLAVCGLRGILNRIGTSAAVYAFAAMLLLHGAFSATAIWQYEHRFEVVMDIWQDIERACPGEQTLVLLDKRSSLYRSPKLAAVRFVDLSDFHRNPFMDPSRLHLKHFRRLNPREVRENFPDHTPCIYRYDILRE
ncbi:Dolichyl-phosphate-mannose-protein mannosyltransferase [Geoalkalibacter ferrihydriticus]|nr:Dolichyl-phosphate-mannose-protein mannosyltransferase [Geoalkalibacter ferrihydriticus]